MEKYREELEVVQEQMTQLVCQKWDLIKKIEESDNDIAYQKAMREYESILEEMEDLGAVLMRCLRKREIVSFAARYGNVYKNIG